MKERFTAKLAHTTPTLGLVHNKKDIDVNVNVCGTSADSCGTTNVEVNVSTGDNSLYAATILLQIPIKGLQTSLKHDFARDARDTRDEHDPVNEVNEVNNVIALTTSTHSARVLPHHPPTSSWQHIPYIIDVDADGTVAVDESHTQPHNNNKMHYNGSHNRPHTGSHTGPHTESCINVYVSELQRNAVGSLVHGSWQQLVQAVYDSIYKDDDEEEVEEQQVEKQDTHDLSMEGYENDKHVDACVGAAIVIDVDAIKDKDTIPRPRDDGSGAADGGGGGGSGAADGNGAAAGGDGGGSGAAAGGGGDDTVAAAGVDITTTATDSGVNIGGQIISNKMPQDQLLETIEPIETRIEPTKPTTRLTQAGRRPSKPGRTLSHPKIS